MVLPFFFPAELIRWNCGSERGEEPSGGCPPPDSDPFSDAEFGRNPLSLSMQKIATTNSPFKFQKRSQLSHPRAQRNAFHHPDARQQ
jgi:hypothetical protein